MPRCISSTSPEDKSASRYFARRFKPSTVAPSSRLLKFFGNGKRRSGRRCSTRTKRAPSITGCRPRRTVSTSGSSGMVYFVAVTPERESEHARHLRVQRFIPRRPLVLDPVEAIAHHEAAHAQAEAPKAAAVAVRPFRVADERVAPRDAALPDRLVALDDLAPPFLVDEAAEEARAAHLRRQLEQMDRIVVGIPAEPGVLVVAEKDRARAVVVRLARQLDREAMLAAGERVGLRRHGKAREREENRGEQQGVPHDALT